MKKAIINWSGGKDCCYALYQLRKEFPAVEVRLLTSVSEATNRVSMHGVREKLIDLQAQLLGLSVEKVYLPESPDNATYEKILANKYDQLKNEGFQQSIFGDIFLEDLRQFREKQMKRVGLKAVFPLWKMNTALLSRQFLADGFKAIIVAADAKLFGKADLGKIYDKRFISELPNDVDPCGENGEFHTVVFDGPGFDSRLDFVTGETVKKYYPSPNGGKENLGFWFLNLLPVKT